jgi:autoaggregation protein RapA/B/C
MVNQKPVAGNVHEWSNFLEYGPVGNILNNTAPEDADGDAVRLNFVNGQRVTWTSDPIVGEYGRLYIRPDGEWEYELDQGNPAVAALEPGKVLTEEFTFKVSDGRGATDFGLLDITIEEPWSGAYTIDFEDGAQKFPSNYKGFSWGPQLGPEPSGEPMQLVTEADGNTYVRTGPNGDGDIISWGDGYDVVIEGFELATSDGSTAIVTLEGWSWDGQLVGTRTVTVSGDDLDTGLHVSLTDLGHGHIGSLHIDFEFPDYDGDPADYPWLKFDDFLIAA